MYFVIAIINVKFQCSVCLSVLKFYIFRLAKSEDVQYFQFDHDGNMYVYEPGSGYTGVPRKVEPGEELHLGTWSEVNVMGKLSDTLPLTSICHGDSSKFESSQVDYSVMDNSQGNRYYLLLLYN